MGSVEDIRNLRPKWATTSIRRRRSIGREIRPPRRFFRTVQQHFDELETHSFQLDSIKLDNDFFERNCA
jgi:hypothetical protein